MSGRRTHTLSSVLLASNLFLSAYCPAADSERYFVEDYFAVSAVSGAEIQANDLQCKTLSRQTSKRPVSAFKTASLDNFYSLISKISEDKYFSIFRHENKKSSKFSK